MVLFDEYEKHFTKETQNEMLSLFDGTSATKKMYCISANETYKMSEYMLDRPGRFHYHMEFTFPTSLEIEEYMNDKLEESQKYQIPKIIQISRNLDINYDCLRAIAFEINQGMDVDDALEDLNIQTNAGENNYYQMVTDVNIRLHEKDMVMKYHGVVIR